MHELSITQNILKIVLDSAKKENASKINEIKITMGELTTYVPDCIQSYFDIVSKDSIAEKAKLTFNRTPAIAVCLDCGKETKIEKRKRCCMFCGGHNMKFTSGREFFVDSIDIE